MRVTLKQVPRQESCPAANLQNFWSFKIGQKPRQLFSDLRLQGCILLIALRPCRESLGNLRVTRRCHRQIC